MHSALLIDEILRHIFLFVSEHHRPSLISAARSCKTWKDPALDFVWNRLPSFEPLLLLLPGITKFGREYSLPRRTSCTDLDAFRAYALRVKHISHRHELRVHRSIPAAFDCLSVMNEIALPSLTTAHISLPRCHADLLFINLAPTLRCLDIDLGFKMKTSSVDSALCDYMEQVGSICSRLEQISIRGLASERLNSIVSASRNLQSLSLRLGHSLSPTTLGAVMTFPHLLELDVQVGHIEPRYFDNIPEFGDNIPFASLKKLHIRGKSAIIETILDHIQPNTLRHLHIELEDAMPSSSSWTTIFDSICAKSAQYLLHLALEHHFEIPEPSGSDTTQSETNNPSSANHSDLSMPFDTMHTLRKLKLLRHFACDITIPPIIHDQDVEKLVSWWPDLEHFELGSVPQTDGEPAPTLPMTMAALNHFAKSSGKLKKLVLPLTLCDLSSMHFAANTSIGHPLESLTVAQLMASNPPQMAGHLHRLFPSLVNLDGPCDESQPWTEAKDALRILCPGS
ncbi:hypothetical protein B0H34DRAFT_858280 [Crassisporium funariophilum]|nr:hypothetical protein B0H34DRAFT_858280 [Crassisporium funariophilum]